MMRPQQKQTTVKVEPAKQSANPVIKRVVSPVTSVNRGLKATHSTVVSTTMKGVKGPTSPALVAKR